MAQDAFHCNCCGRVIDLAQGDECPQCGYPVELAKEERFLSTALKDLQRVATYGGSHISIGQLINRYNQRLQYLNQVIPTQGASEVSKAASPTQNVPVRESAVPQASFQPAAVGALAGIQPTVQSVVNTQRSAPRGSERMFSFKTFFADQTINVLASLGAFLVLVGSLSFIATTADHLLAFLVLLIVHAVFGLTGAFSYRFRSFRTVSVIYTAIYALQVPLVGFAGDNLVLGNISQLSVPTVVAITALYAALAYGALAIYQKFQPFGYLAVISLVVADLAVCLAYNLGLWWWPGALMLLAFPALVSVSRSATPSWLFHGHGEVLREPVRFLMYACIYAGLAFCCLASLPFSLFSQEACFSLFFVTMLLLCWICLYIWRTAKTQYGVYVAYVLLLCVATLAYALNFEPIGYALAFTGVAVFYCGLVGLAHVQLQHFKRLRRQLLGLVLLLVAIVPLLVAPLLPLQILQREYVNEWSGLAFQATDETFTGIVLLLVGSALTLFVILNSTGLRKLPVGKQGQRCWLLLLTGVIVNWAYGMVLLASGSDPVGLIWGMLGFTCVVFGLGLVVRRWTSVVWADPLDALALVISIETLILSTQYAGFWLSLTLGFAVLANCSVVYQRHPKWLFVPCVFAVLALFTLSSYPLVFFSLGLLFPLLAAAGYLLIKRYWTGPVDHRGQSSVLLLAGFPLLASGIVYGISFALHDAYSTSSEVQHWLGVTFPYALEIGLLSLAWYTAAVLGRVKWWLVIAIGFGVAALLVPSNTFWIFICLAPLLLILAAGISRLFGRDWGLPLYVLAVVAAVMMGFTGSTLALRVVTTWALLLFSILIYLVGILEREVIVKPVLLWAGACFACWAVYTAGLIGGSYLYFPPSVALAGAAIGVSIGYLYAVITHEERMLRLVRRLQYVRPVYAMLVFLAHLVRRLHYVLPVYATAVFAAVLTGIYGIVEGVNYPFYAAIPMALCVYALVTYAVLLVERKPGGLWLVAAFALWATFLLPQMVSNYHDSAQVQMALFYATGLALFYGVLGLVGGRLKSGAARGIMSIWNWPWYFSSVVTMGLVVVGDAIAGTGLARGVVLGTLGLLLLFSIVCMLLERAPLFLFVVAVLASYLIADTHWLLWQQMSAYTLLCVLIFATQFVWRVLPPAISEPSAVGLHRFLGLGGQLLVVLVTIGQGGLAANSGWLAQVGVASLAILALLLFWYGRIQSTMSLRRGCDYIVGLLLALVVMWELLASGSSDLALLVLAPASYLIVIAPFLSRDEDLPQHHQLGKLCSVVGALALLLPTLWLSFGTNELTMTLLLASEAFVLLVLGAGMRVRFFVLSGAGLVIVSAIHLVFLKSLGIPPFLALSLVGIMLLVLATVLLLVRTRVALLWDKLE